MNQIVISFPIYPEIKKQEIHNLVNRSLDSIKNDIISWNGFVDMRIVDNEFMLIAKCDNEEIRSKMQWLLNIELNRLKAA